MSGEHSLRRSGLSLRHALSGFAVAYTVITALAFGLYLVAAAVMGVSTSSAFDLRNDPAYQVAEKIYPVLNLLVWGACARFCVPRRADPTFSQALALGALWLAIALPLDLVSFVLVPNPLSLSAYDFYVGQFPWIYFTYLVVFAGPPAYVWLARSLSGRAGARDRIGL